MVEVENGMQKKSLTAMVRHHLDHARNAPAGRSSETVYGGHEHVLRQTVIALRAGQRLDDHDNHGDATVQVLEGRILLASGDASWSGWRGDLLTVPLARHSLEALEDAVILLTVAKLIAPAGSVPERATTSAAGPATAGKQRQVRASERSSPGIRTDAGAGTGTGTGTERLRLSESR